MPGKRRRIGEHGPGLSPAEKPLSAIAAARLRAEATTKPTSTPEVIVQPVTLPSTPDHQLPDSDVDAPHVEQDFVPAKRNLRLCNWRNDSSDILTDTGPEISINLNKHATIALVGCFDLKVLRGAVHINGANIGTVDRTGQKGTLHRVYASATHPIPKIRGLDATNHVQFVSCKEPTLLGTISPFFDDIWHRRSTFKPQRSFIIGTDSEKDPLSRPLIPDVAPEDWLRAIEDCSSSASITVVTGSSNSGKSVFAKRLTNRVLTGLGKAIRPVTAVCYLDLDPSKQEYAPGGQISLLMLRDVNLCPSFTHPTTKPVGSNPRGNEMIRAHPVPADLVNYLDYYQSCVEDLFLTFQSLQSHDAALSLVVDTPGFFTTPSYDTLAKVLARLKPHNIVHLGDLQAIDTESASVLHTLHTAVSQYRSTVHEIGAQWPLPITLRSDAEMQAMQMQSYFHSKDASKKSASTSTPAWTQEPLSHMLPWELSYQELNEQTQDIVGFAMYTEPIEPKSLVHALNGSVIHIIQSTSAVIPHPYTSLPRTGKHQIPTFPVNERTAMVEPFDPRTSNLVCTAMIRGFDLERGVVQLLVPRTVEPLMYHLAPDRTVLVSGCCSTPEWAFIEDAYFKEHAALRNMVDASSSDMEEQPWVMREEFSERMGYLNTVRRVRKFQT
ncbi:hypothetical protein T440DRAFT_558469 [Plenodomus tracheiphilus IPT5]|uniref:Polynucleotide 5'-hydroxyl-kinase GRC3 n=1 Tax=Plenodomus tracheiphilus IPT5 TaxID=1408161 RepID=A0A6A7ASG0_9PLEO|nr:hypothetical protein T440DRAFT_558469 [Plenodomus tracheiphilus IPT5]